jgi:hypothetical protein
MKRAASSAVVQIAAQAVMLQKFEEITGKRLTPNQILFDDVVIQLDGYCETEDKVILAECWAHIGKAKVAQKHKIAADILKMSLASVEIRKRQPHKILECYLIFADEEASDVVRSSSWMSAAARHHSVVPVVVSLDLETVERIKQAQKAQDLRETQEVKSAAHTVGQ